MLDWMDRPKPKRRKRRVVTRANSNRARNLAPPPWVGEVVSEVRMLMGVPSKRLLILWRRRNGTYSSGHAKPRSGEIVITAGADEFDQGDVLLHELAHWLCRASANHNQTFWRTYWRLIAHFGMNADVALKRSYAYRKRSAIAYGKTEELHNG